MPHKIFIYFRRVSYFIDISSENKGAEVSANSRQKRRMEQSIKEKCSPYKVAYVSHGYIWKKPQTRQIRYRVHIHRWHSFRCSCCCQVDKVSTDW